MKKLVVLLPTYNEAENIEKMVDRVLKQGESLKNWRVIVLISDSSSPDGTGKIAKQLSKKSPFVYSINVGRGLGVGLIKGFQYAIKYLHPDALAQLDSDGQIDPKVIKLMIDFLDKGYNLILGSRFIKGSVYSLPWLRKLLSYTSIMICRIFIGPLTLTEFNASARAFTPQLFKKMDLNKLPWKERSYIVLPSFVHQAILAGAKYKEVPVTCTSRIGSNSKNRILSYSYDVLTYSLECFVNKLGFNIPIFAFSRKFKFF